MDEDYKYHEARKRVKKKKGFYSHLGVYLAINTVFFFVTLFNGGGLNWLVPASMWGIGLSMHYLNVFGFPGVGVGGSEWEANEIQKEMGKMDRGQVELPNEGLELKEIEKRKSGWDENDLV